MAKRTRMIKLHQDGLQHTAGGLDYGGGNARLAGPSLAPCIDTPASLANTYDSCRYCAARKALPATECRRQAASVEVKPAITNHSRRSTLLDCTELMSARLHKQAIHAQRAGWRALHGAPPSTDRHETIACALNKMSGVDSRSSVTNAPNITRWRRASSVDSHGCVAHLLEKPS